MGRLLRKLGIQRKEARAWAIYDWANSAFYTVIITAVYPIYYSEVAGAGLDQGVALRRYGVFLGISTGVMGFAAPALGAIADYVGKRKLLLGICMAVGVLATGGMFFVEHGDWLLGGILVALANAGMVGSLVCYDGLLTHAARGDDVDVLSTTGYGLGYLGGALPLVLCFLCISHPAWFGLPGGEGLSPEQATLPARLGFVAAAAWWAVFSIPLFLHLTEPPRRTEPDEQPGTNPVRAAFVRLLETLRELRGYRDLWAMLLASLIYGEGIGTIIKLAGGYAKDLDLEQTAIMGALILAQFVGLPCSFLFGRLAQRAGARTAIYLALAVYVGACVYAYFIQVERDFYVLALAIGAVQGGAQALSRSLFASLIPEHKSTEFFGFFAFASKVAGFSGPLVFWLVGSFSSSNRPAVLVISLFFVAGGLLLSRVDVNAGRSAARKAEAELRGDYST